MRRIHGLKKFTHAKDVTLDEFYFFRRQILPQKNTPKNIAASSSGTSINDISKIKQEIVVKVESDLLLDDSLDGGSLSIGSDGILSESLGTINTPGGKKKKDAKKLLTGYLLFSGEVRKSIVQNNPDCTFGDISRIVGNEWRAIPAADKQIWEDKATKINKENAAKGLLVDGFEGCVSPTPAVPDNPNKVTYIFNKM